MALALPGAHFTVGRIHWENDHTMRGLVKDYAFPEVIYSSSPTHIRSCTFIQQFCTRLTNTALLFITSFGVTTLYI